MTVREEKISICPEKNSGQRDVKEINMKKKRYIMGLVLALVVLSAVITACTGKNGSKEELVLYTWQGMFPQEVLDGFAEKTGSKVVYSNFDTDETMLERLSQAKGGSYDVVVADDYIIEQVIASGLASEIDRSVVTNFGNINPLYQGHFYDPEDKYTIPHGAGIPLIVYDPERVDLEIRGYADLWNPALKDSVALIGNYRVINGITLLTMGKSMNETDPAVIGEAGKKLLELAPNVRMIQDDNTQNALLNGEASVAFLYTSQVTRALEENPGLRVVYPQEGLGFGILGAFVPSQAPHKDLANQFLNYLLEPEVSRQCFEYNGYYNTNKAADAIVTPALVVPESVTSGEIIQNVPGEANEAYDRNWIEFKAACGEG